MSKLAQDFNWYYQDSYIGYREAPDGPVVPFYIQSIEWTGLKPIWDGGDWEPPEHLEEYEARDSWYESDEYHDFSEEAYDSIVFVGHLVTDEGRGHRNIHVSGFNNPKLEFKNPLLGFMSLRNDRSRRTWITYVAGRSVKKGLSSNRISTGLNSHIAWQAYAMFESDRIERDYWLDPRTGYVHYKHNTIIATKDSDVDTIYIDPMVAHLSGDLQERFPRCQIVQLEL